jgi:S1-C subfamily serine protease
MSKLLVVLLTSTLLLLTHAKGLQQMAAEHSVPVATEWVLNSTPTTQHAAIKSVYLLVCRKTNKKGTGFLLDSGVIVTNSHVVGSCNAPELEGTSVMGTPVQFSDKIVDENRDLALLRPSTPQFGGLKLGADTNPQIQQGVSTWGFPLTYNGPAPLLTMGYVAGFREDRRHSRPVKRLIINGAFNPGNSGGPLLENHTNTIIGVVVEKWTLYSQLAETAIQGFSKPGGISTAGRFSITDENGSTKSVSDQEVLAAVLDEFYKMSQVVIGEAISVSELKAFLHEHQTQLGSWQRPTPLR